MCIKIEWTEIIFNPLLPKISLFEQKFYRRRRLIMEEQKTPGQDEVLDLSIGEELKDNLLTEVCKPIIEQINWPA